MNTVVKENYDLMMREIKDALEKWTTLSISMSGQINIFKTTILSKYLYVFQSLPLPSAFI